MKQRPGQVHNSATPRAVHHRTRRNGYTLVFIVMMLFGILGLAALVIDIGFARLTQLQLQAAADSGAIEGLRGEGDNLLYENRLDSAKRFIEWQFDDDLNAAADDGAFDSGTGQFGAGPLVQFSDGAGDASLAASQLMEVDSSNPVYKPQVENGTPSGAGSFQVALRRGATDVTTSDLHDSGPAVPFLFARGSLISRQLINDGITVRANGRAQSTPALSIGLANDSAALPGLIPLTLELNFWNALTTDSASLQSIASGVIGSSGRFFTRGSTETMPLTVGRPIPSAASPPDGSFQGYVPIYANLTSSSTSRVVGFGVVQVVVTNGGTTASITRLPGRVGAENVSAVRCFSVSLTAPESAEIFSLISDVGEALMAPRSE